MALDTQKTRYFILCLIIAFLSSYTKEPAFLIYLTIAFTGLAYKYKNNKIENKQTKLYLGFILNAIIFLLLYYFLSYSKAEILYTENRQIPYTIHELINFFSKEKTLLIICFIGFFKLWEIFKLNKKNVYYDSLLFASISYCLSYIIIGFNYSYYFTPCFIIATPSLLFYSIKILNKSKWYLILLLFLFLFSDDYNLKRIEKDIKFNEYSRKVYIEAITKYYQNYKKGYNLVWLNKPTGFEDTGAYISFNKGLVYLDRKNKKKYRNKKDFIKEIDALPKNLDDKYCIFYAFFAPETQKDEFQNIKNKLKDKYHIEWYNLYYKKNKLYIFSRIEK